MLKAKSVKSQEPVCGKSFVKSSEDVKGQMKGKRNGERVGDWVCFKCSNLNYSFRQVCNRCSLSQHESKELSGAQPTNSVFSTLGF